MLRRRSSVCGSGTAEAPLMDLTNLLVTTSVATLIDSRTSFASWYIFLDLEPSKNKVTII